MPSLKFPETMATRGHLKIAKTHYFALFFFCPSKLISKCCNFSMEIELESKVLSALVTRYPMIDLGPFLASQKSKIVALSGARQFYMR
jgi:hypothetical protein